jgi:hypothetical protein
MQWAALNYLIIEVRVLRATIDQQSAVIQEQSKRQEISMIRIFTEHKDAIAGIKGELQTLVGTIRCLKRAVNGIMDKLQRLGGTMQKTQLDNHRSLTDRIKRARKHLLDHFLGSSVLKMTLDLHNKQVVEMKLQRQNLEELLDSRTQTVRELEEKLTDNESARKGVELMFRSIEKVEVRMGMLDEIFEEKKKRRVMWSRLVFLIFLMLIVIIGCWRMFWSTELFDWYSMQ